MKGFSVTIFVEDGLKGWKADYKAIAASNAAELRQQLAFITAALVRQLESTGGVGGKDVGLYLEIYEVPAALQAMYEWVANAQAHAQAATLKWEDHKSLASWAKEAKTNGQK